MILPAEDTEKYLSVAWRLQQTMCLASTSMLSMQNSRVVKPPEPSKK